MAEGALYFFFHENDNARLFGSIASIAVILGISIYLFTIEAGLFSIGILASVIGLTIYVFTKKQNKEQTRKRNDKPYINHCWNCKHPIDSRVDIKCPKCRTFYICPKCGKCYCDSDEYKHNHGGY